MPAPLKIQELIKRFEEHLAAYKSGAYNETQVRREFIDPFFKELGWDIDNQGGLAEAYKDVIHEDAIRIGGFSKAPDYCFRVGGARKFFLEAKKPSIDLKEDENPAHQLRRYGWSAKLPLSILTDFEEFAVYDCRIKPLKNDKAAIGRIFYCKFTDYAAKWDEIAGIFSKDAVLKGAFDKYADSAKGKRGTGTVDAAFLQEIESWRSELARNIAIRNSKLTSRQLNFAVQKTIDRIIFLRICEDRGIETYGKLQGLVNADNLYSRLFEIFERADERYNSGLFHFHSEGDVFESPDDITPRLKIDDKVLKDILKSLYPPESPYAFSVLPVEILGQVYEQFLGQVIHLTDGHRAKIEEKPEVKKAGGVYYTPAYIVDYIVKNTVGKLLEGKTPKQASKLKVLDPACGSGSFLIGAYQYLLDWHRDWYVKDGTEKWTKGKQPVLYEHGTHDWRLTTSEKKKILLNNIYGVDIDSQAVEVTKLSLLLKVLEGENGEVLNKQLQLFHERVLPDLGSNIKCGNSLIGSDFYSSQQLDLFSDEDRIRINAFDWLREFPAIMENGGFDAVIGNPPYIFTREQLSDGERQYFATRYKLSWEKHNTYMLFMEKMLWLLGKQGRGGYIVPNSWLTIESARFLREAMVPRLDLVADLNYLVFRRVSMEPCIFTARGHDLEDKVFALRVNSESMFTKVTPVVYDRGKWRESNHRIVFSEDPGTSKVVDKVLQKSLAVGDVFDVRTGLQAYEEGKGTPPQTASDVRDHVFDRAKRVDENSVKYLQGRDVGRYALDWSGMWMQYGRWLSQPREIDIFKRPRVLLREITADYPYCLNAMFAAGVYLNNKSVLNVLHNSDDDAELKKLLGILNSRLMSIFYKQKAVKGARKVFPKVVIKNLREFPYPRTIGQGEGKKIVQLVEQRIDLQKSMVSVRTDHEKTVLQRQIDATDREIDQLVYQLYGLTPDEIKVVEETSRKA